MSWATATRDTEDLEAPETISGASVPGCFLPRRELAGDLWLDLGRLMHHEGPGGCGEPVALCQCAPGYYGRPDPEEQAEDLG